MICSIRPPAQSAPHPTRSGFNAALSGLSALRISPRSFQPVMLVKGEVVGPDGIPSVVRKQITDQFIRVLVPDDQLGPSLVASPIPEEGMEELGL